MTHENTTEDDLCRHCDRTGTTLPGTATGKDHHENGRHVVPGTSCGKDVVRTDWETIDAGSVNFHWREVCSHWGHVSESLFA